MNITKFTVSKTSTGFDAIHEDNAGLVITTGDNLTELRNNALEAYNLHAEENGKKPIEADHITFEFDLPSVFEFYKVINASALGERVGISRSLLSQYVTGVKKPSEKQVQKIFAGIKQVGKELYELELA